MKIILTGGAGFIGSGILWKLNQMGHDDILVVDDLATSEKWKNLNSKRFNDYIEKGDLLNRLEANTLNDYDCIIHMGACSSTTGTDASYYIKNNYEYTRILAEHAVKHNTRFLYASSAATYGDGEKGFSDDDRVTPTLRPLNMYGYSKQLFDLWVLRHNLQKKFAGFKFFNVYGPNEYHKDDMRNLICKVFDKVVKDKKIGLFKSYHPEYKDGEQKRDFVYIKDVVDMVYYFVENPEKSGIFNMGSGKAATWNELAEALFAALKLPLKIDYIDMPEILRNKYQYFTEAPIEKLRANGYTKPCTPLKAAVADYVNYLSAKTYL